eukprot:scaffold8130_cov1223-Prasinococcus_capsulatus_cf.AAC.1
MGGAQFHPFIAALGNLRHRAQRDARDNYVPVAFFPTMGKVGRGDKRRSFEQRWIMNECRRIL